MKNYYSLIKKITLSLMLSMLLFNSKAQTPITYNYTGAVQTVNLSAGVYQIECWGADGNRYSGSSVATKGGYSKGIYVATAPITLYIVVGQCRGATTGGNQGACYNGGGSGGTYGGSGGGASHVATTTGVLSALSGNQSAVLIVAGGGGGSGYSTTNGGHGGGLTGLNGGQGSATTFAGGGTQMAGGAGGTGATNGDVGTFGQGGGTTGNGGGGGGGWYGGGRGAGSGVDGGGGGGSAYIGGVTNGTTIVTGASGFITNPVNTGHGYVIITPLSIPIDVTASSLEMCIGGSPITMTASANGVSSYTWLPVGNFAGSNSPTIAVNPTVTTVYTVQGTHPTMPVTSKTIAITVYGTIPSITANSSSTLLCSGNTAT
ncbi:MAG: hypothetical protein KF900_10960, partial [Bacteroidetes bacterium]|nr:hypothetical protein [Bacteroidota bacterium]